MQIKNDRVVRVVPLENEAINECWLSDKDRFSYEALNSQDRLTQPMLKRDGKWIETDWQTALDYVTRELKRIRARHGATALGALVSPHATLEEMHLLQKLVRGLGWENIDFRLRHSDFSADGRRQGATWLGMSITEFAALDRVLVIGSFLRKDHPLLAQRLRQMVKKGAQLALVHAAADELLIKVAQQAIVPPSAFAHTLGQIAVAAAGAAGKALPPALAGIESSPVAAGIAALLAGGSRRGIFLGSFAEWHPQAAQLHALASAIAELTGSTLGFLTEAANSVGGTVAGVYPRKDGLHAAAMLGAPRRAYLLLHADPEFDSADPATTCAALGAAELVIALSPFKSGAAAQANVLLPVAPFTETAGTFINCEGRIQSFNSVVPPLGQTRPAWKVLRMLGSLLSLPGFDYESVEAIRRDLPGEQEIGNWLSNATQTPIETPSAPDGRDQFERIAEVPIYAADSLVRRAASLQRTRDAAPAAARVNAATLARLKLGEGTAVRIRQGGGGGDADSRSRCGRAGRLRARRRGTPVDAHAGANVRPPSRWKACDGRGARVLRLDLARRHRAGRNRCHHRAADPGGRLPDALGAQAHRLDARAPRAQPRRPARPAAADRRRGQAAVQGSDRADAGRHCAVLRSRRCSSMMPALAAWAVIPFARRAGAGQHQRRPAVRDGDHLARRVRRDHRRLGVELEVRLPGRAARLGADGVLRDSRWASCWSAC